MNIDIAVIGAGPAGIAAAVQLKRFDLDPRVFEKNRIGGLLWNAHWIENYPGFPAGISGARLAGLFENHLETFHIPVIADTIISLDYPPGQERFLLTTTTGDHTADFVIVASGTVPTTAGIIDIVPKELARYVVFDIFPLLGLPGKNIVIVGGGDIAFDYALHLSQFQGNHITLVLRSEKVTALPLLARRVRDTANICLVSSATIQKVEKGNTYPLRLTFEKNGAAVVFDADILVGAIGRVPHSDFFSPRLCKMEEQLMTGGHLHKIGDVKNGRFRQAAIAAGNGIKAAMKIYEYKNRGNR